MSPLALSLRFLQTQSDAQLAALARAGHERAFEALVRRYRRPLLAYCRRVGSAGVSPEDTLQQALLQAWSAIRTGVDVRDPRAWLYRIVHNVAVSNQRHPALVPVELRETAGANGADFEAEQRMAARAALAGLAALPHLQREVMVGTAVDGLSHEELASALGLSSGAVRGLIYRARATLRAAAAAIVPAPVIGWALRSGSGRASGVYEALGGSGSAGLGGILLKGGAIAATAGAIATAGISTNNPSAHHHATQASVGGTHHAARQQALASAATASAVLVDDPARASSPTVREGPGGGSQHAASRETSDRGSASSSAGFVAGRGSDGASSSGTGDSGDGSGGPGPSGGSKSGSGHSGPGGGSGSDGSDGSDGLTTGRGGHDSGRHGSDDPAGDLPGSDGGSSGGGGGGSGGSSGGHDGGGNGGSGGGDSATGASTPVTTATPDDGSDRSGHDGGSSTSTTTTVTTVSSTVDDDGGSRHQQGK